VVAWVKAFQAKYGYAPTASSAEAYDAVHLAVAAIEQAKSIDPSAIKAALGTLHDTSGICTTDYHSDAAHNFEHLITVLGWATGTPKTIANLKQPDEKAGQPNPAG
jgi:ABC-type branched-subunit amino acid transport system substrate-binding protein